MVLFININLNQRVEVDVGGDVYTGTVKYKGSVNGVSGDWVGVALDKARGRHDGTVNGRRYFSCRPDHGLFTTADKIRFISIRRNKYDSYRPVSRQSEVDEALFTSYSNQVIEQERDPRDHMGWVSENYLNRATKIFPESGGSYDGPVNHHLRHSVSKFVPAYTMLRPTVTPARFTVTDSCGCYPDYHQPLPTYHSAYHYADYNPDTWISAPSVPKPHMPRGPLERQVARGWDGEHYVREMSVHTGRDSMKFSQWNDISE